ncbi:hypothetical protein C8Q70DRAFT_1056109 [Cubamyces menziesii]|nr:hypothetical protein C8Q70DRAFT_1056109 [Cubamyces menziesii]
MKFFSSILPTVGIAMLGAVSVLAQSSDVIITGLQTVTQSSRDLRTVVETITLFNAPVQGPKVATGLTNIGQSVVTVTKTITQGNFDPFSDDVAEDIVAALTAFVQVHQALLDTIIGKHRMLTLVGFHVPCILFSIIQGILQKTPFTKPVGLALQGLEAIVDTFAFAIIGLIPTRQDTAMTQLTSLDVTFTQSTNVYNS